MGKRKLRVTTDNVAAFTLTSEDFGKHRDGTRLVSIDRQEMGELPLGVDLHFARMDGQWQQTQNVTRPVTAKKPGVSGPIQDIWFDRFTIIYGTADPHQTEANRMTAEALQRYSPWITTNIAIMRDRDVQPDQLKGQGLMLVGGPASNTITRRAIASLPVTFDPQGLVFNGTRYDGDQVGISLVHPNPFDRRARLGPSCRCGARRYTVGALLTGVLTRLCHLRPKGAQPLG